MGVAERGEVRVSVVVPGLQHQFSLTGNTCTPRPPRGSCQHLSSWHCRRRNPEFPWTCTSRNDECRGRTSENSITDHGQPRNGSGVEPLPLSWLWERNKLVRPPESHVCAEMLTCTADRLLRPTLMLVGGKKAILGAPPPNDVDTKSDSRLACQDALT